MLRMLMGFFRLFLLMLIFFLNTNLFANALLGMLKEAVSEVTKHKNSNFKEFVITSKDGMGVQFSTSNNKEYKIQFGVASAGVFHYTKVMLVFGNEEPIDLDIINTEVRRLTGAKDISERTNKEEKEYGIKNEYYIYANFYTDSKFLKRFLEYDTFSFYFVDENESYKTTKFTIDEVDYIFNYFNASLINLLTEDKIVFK